ncbi:antitermination protein NusG [Pseudomonas agarici]|uniref:Antitermination protein NusG n=1 Tax=Pseudomonas agarici TaxID=46677 RepID=A0A0X1T835_PSEAA|nr:transcription/translation regulatory transformer protein RfaH [Pseudomonas agarici]AMB88265.1 antitermination protein NusG [Pseudomonas agarici]NWB91920.1 transcription/translation regulatory transformer protein RfaH [Pseudomonas agarici]NWC11306.1 transcription/translation regulatory transformer protein RfaH [Pseudomonas agarici]
MSLGLPGRAWYLVLCKACQDERAEVNLVNQGYTCFRPMRRRERVLRGRRRVVCESLFPSYLFIQLGADDSWAPLRSTRGVSRVVSFGGKPLAVHDEVIAQLYEHDSVAPLESHFSFGERVHIKQGPFVELEAIFLAMEGEERVVLLMQLLQREQRISVPLADVRKH